MNIQFIGAARTVTGSMHLLSVNGSKILLDCGLYQGKRAEAFERNMNFPFDPATIDAVVVSHAHIDHSGNLPNLVKHGFRGPIYSTAATRNLANVMLYDSAYIQKRDAEYMTKRHLEKGLPKVEPLYTTEDVFETIGRFIGIGYHQRVPVADGVWVTFSDAGHLLGSAATVLELKENGKTVRLGYTGDVGRKNMPILKDPEPMGDVDVLISESTYGGKVHDPISGMKDSLLKVISRTYERGGKIIVPSFAVGRTQELLYVLFQLQDEGLLPKLPIYVDSPLSVNATEVFRLHPECYDKEMAHYLYEREDPFGFQRLKFIRSVEESKELNTLKEPCMIIASSGMCEAGRILHHLANNMENPKNTILIVGFQAEHTLGYRIVQKLPEVTLLGEVFKLKSEVVVLNSFSAHAGQDELMEYLTAVDRKRVKQLYLVHGEMTQAEPLAAKLKAAGFRNVSIPVHGQKEELA